MKRARRSRDVTARPAPPPPAGSPAPDRDTPAAESRTSRHAVAFLERRDVDARRRPRLFSARTSAFRPVERRRRGNSSVSTLDERLLRTRSATIRSATRRRRRPRPRRAAAASGGVSPASRIHALERRPDPALPPATATRDGPASASRSRPTIRPRADQPLQHELEHRRRGTSEEPLARLFARHPVRQRLRRMVRLQRRQQRVAQRRRARRRRPSRSPTTRRQAAGRRAVDVASLGRTPDMPARRAISALRESPAPPRSSMNASDARRRICAGRDRAAGTAPAPPRSESRRAAGADRARRRRRSSRAASTTRRMNRSPRVRTAGASSRMRAYASARGDLGAGRRRLARTATATRPSSSVVP